MELQLADSVALDALDGISAFLRRARGLRPVLRAESLPSVFDP